MAPADSGEVASDTCCSDPKIGIGAGACRELLAGLTKSDPVALAVDKDEYGP